MQKHITKPKKHYAILDGLRGIAAISVVVFHFMECAITDYSKNFIAHGYLAVDFFFCLSGFVIAYAYQDRLAHLSLKKFILARLIRLQPMVILGGILGIIAFYISPYDSYQWSYPIWQVGLMLIATWTVIPNPVMEERFFNNFGFNAPEWSLFWEYIANILYAIIGFRLQKNWLYIISIVSGILLIYIAVDANSLMGGWGKDTFWHGTVRLFWSFSVGILVYKLQWKINNRLGFWGLSFLLLCSFLFPYKNDSLANSLYEIFAVMIYYPMLLALGVGSYTNNRSEKWCKISGDTSYPLYMLHYSMIWIFASYNNSKHPDTGQLFWIISIGTSLAVVISYWVYLYIDEPIRKKLLRAIYKPSH